MSPVFAPSTRLTRVKLLLKVLVVESAEADKIVETAITDVRPSTTDFRALENIFFSVFE
jgi:hypothetical protein